MRKAATMIENKKLQQTLLPYNSTISGKAGLIIETQLILEQIAEGQSITNIRNEVLNDNLLGKKTFTTRDGIWKNVRQRYLAGSNEIKVQILAKFVALAVSPQARYLALFYTFAQRDTLLYDFSAELLYHMYHSGRTGIEKADVFNWFDTKLANGHTEISNWSPQTRNKLVSHLLSIARDFGLLDGVQRKTFRRVYIPLSSFLYVLYDQYSMGLNGRELIEAKVFRLFLLDQEDVLRLLDEAAHRGFITFRHTVNMYDLKLRYKSLEEVVDYVITAQIS